MPYMHLEVRKLLVVHTPCFENSTARRFYMVLLLFSFFILCRIFMGSEQLTCVDAVG